MFPMLFGNLATICSFSADGLHKLGSRTRRMIGDKD